jgi:hypothetical protein
MTSAERKQCRYQRRKAKRDQKKHDFISKHDDFSHVISPDNLYTAYKKSKRGVAWKESVQRYGMNVFMNIADTIYKLERGQNVTCGFVEFFLKERGKVRHIRSVHISERVVQKCLCDQVLVPVLSRPLIYDNGASLKNKGLHFAIRRLITHMSKYYRQNKNNTGYCLQIDFKKYFDSIRHDILFKSIREHLKDERVIKLLYDFIKPFGNGISLGLGSQVSQITALFHANILDHFIKEKCGIKYYGRYMDDLYLIHRSKKYLLECLAGINEICVKLDIRINERKTKITKLKDGVHFLKGIYYLKPNGKIVRIATQDSRKRMKKKIRKFKRLYELGRMSTDDVRVAYQSWRGNYRRRFNAYHTIRRMDALYNELFINNHHLEGNYGRNLSLEGRRQSSPPHKQKGSLTN